MKPPFPPLGRIALMMVMALCLSAPAIQAQTSLDFVSFEADGVSNVQDLEYIDLDALIVSTAGGVSIEVQNNSVAGSPGVTASQPTVTKIFFEDRAGVLGDTASVATSTGDVSFVRDDGASLPGGNRIGFEVTTAFTATPPPSKYGIDPGEALVFLFSGTAYDALIASIVSGDFRIGLHVQQIGLRGEDSAAFVSVPEPGAAMLGLLGALMLLRRSR